MEFDLERAQALWEDGVSLDRMAEELEIPRTTLQDRIKRRPEIFQARKQRMPINVFPQCQINRAAKMWANDMSITKIGETLGRSRNSISGMMSRNRELFPLKQGETRGKNKSARSLPPKPKKTAEKKAQEKQAKLSANALRKMFSEALKPAPIIPSKAENKAYDEERLSSAYTLLDLPSNGCKFPLLETVKGETQYFCGERRYQMKPWCAAHHARVWRAA